MRTVLFLLYLISIQAYSQSEFIEDNSFGLGAGFTYARNDIAYSSTLDFAISFLGTADLGFQVGGGEVDYENVSEPVNTSANLVYASYNFKRRNNDLVIKVSAGYFTGSVESGYISDISTSGLLLGLGVYPRFLNSQKFDLRFALDLSYGFLSNDSQSDDSRTISLGLSFLIGASENFHIIFTPLISKDLVNSENSIYYGINSRMLISFAANEETQK
jgi:hypothetical protein